MGKNRLISIGLTAWGWIFILTGLRGFLPHCIKLVAKRNHLPLQVFGHIGQAPKGKRSEPAPLVPVQLDQIRKKPEVKKIEMH